MKNLVKVFGLVMALVFVLNSYTTVEAKTTKVSDYRRQAERIEKKFDLNVVDTADLTYKATTHRKGTVLVERVIGRVKNNNGDGKVLNNGNNPYNYICYKDWIDCKKGDVIVTYVLYNPENNVEDDFIARWDYKLKK